MRFRGVLFAALGACLAVAAPTIAQHTGGINGKVEALVQLS